MKLSDFISRTPKLREGIDRYEDPETGDWWDDDGNHGNTKTGKSYHMGKPIDDGRSRSRKPARVAGDVTGKFYHDVPYVKKDAAKEEGMRFDGDRKKWYHTSAEASDASAFKKLAESALTESVEALEKLAPDDLKAELEAYTEAELMILADTIMHKNVSKEKQLAPILQAVKVALNKRFGLLVKEDWGSSDWYPVMQNMAENLHAGMSLLDAAYEAGSFYKEHMGYPDTAQGDKDMQAAVARKWIHLSDERKQFFTALAAETHEKMQKIYADSAAKKAAKTNEAVGANHFSTMLNIDAVKEKRSEFLELLNKWKAINEKEHSSYMRRGGSGKGDWYATRNYYKTVMMELSHKFQQMFAKSPNTKKYTAINSFDFMHSTPFQFWKLVTSYKKEDLKESALMTGAVIGAAVGAEAVFKAAKKAFPNSKTPLRDYLKSSAGAAFRKADPAAVKMAEAVDSELETLDEAWKVIVRNKDGVEKRFPANKVKSAEADEWRNSSKKPAPKEKTDKSASKAAKEELDRELHRRITNAISSSFPDGEPLDRVESFLRRHDLDIKDVDRVMKRFEKTTYNGYLADMWDDFASDSVADAKADLANGHVPQDSAFFRVTGTDGNKFTGKEKIVMNGNPWK